MGSRPLIPLTPVWSTLCKVDGHHSNVRYVIHGVGGMHPKPRGGYVERLGYCMS